MDKILKITVLAGSLLAITGCTTTIRNVTSTYWTQNGLYVGYWEGTCKPILGCGVGDGKVQWCALENDNGLSCSEQSEVSALLAR